LANDIHPTAVIADQAQLGTDNRIGPYVVIEADTVIGNGNTFGAHAVIKRRTRIADNNTIAEHAVLGGLPQDLGFKERDTDVVIGSGNVLRENVTINRATKENGATRLGDDNYFMTQVHIGHDCQIGNNVIIAPSTGIGGHVHIHDRAFISGGVMVHQFSRIGSFAMIGGNSKITRDALPFFMTDGVPASVRGLNMVGLKRAGFKLEDIRALKEAYRILFDNRLSLEARLSKTGAIENIHVEQLVEFIAASKRGFHRDKPDFRAE